METEDGMGVVGWLSPEQRFLDFKVVVGSLGDWGWAEGWRQLGIRNMCYVAFTEEALVLARVIWGRTVNLERSADFLNSIGMTVTSTSVIWEMFWI
jgi:hypothetical protein